MELDNVYNSVYNATLNITVSATFTMSNRRNPAAAGLQAPDVVLPISSLVSKNNTAGWFTLSSPTAVATVPVVVPSNTHRAVLEVYASGHGCDEFWYSVRGVFLDALRQRLFILAHMFGVESLMTLPSSFIENRTPLMTTFPWLQTPASLSAVVVKISLSSMQVSFFYLLLSTNMKLLHLFQVLIVSFKFLSTVSCRECTFHSPRSTLVAS